MTQVYVKYNPYRLETEIKVNGQDVPQGQHSLQNHKRENGFRNGSANFPKCSAKS